MKIKIENLQTKKQIEFDNKQELIDFFIKNYEDVIFGNNEEDNTRMEILVGNTKITIYNILYLMRGNYTEI